jgi:hypothetical protein
MMIFNCNMDILNLKDLMTDSIISQFNTSLSKIFEDIEKQYDIPKNELEERYLIGTISEPILSETKLKKSKPIEKQFCCLARKQDGGQCTRRRKEGDEYCGKHAIQRKYGRIDDNEVICTTETTHIPEDKVATWEIRFGEKTFLRDINGVVYDNDKIIGKLAKDETIILIDNECKKIGKMNKDGSITKV